MAHRTAKKTARISKDSRAKRLGVKLHDGMKAKAGNIIIRQRGTRYLPGMNVRLGRDDTLYAVSEGVVRFKTKKLAGFHGRLRQKKVVEVLPLKKL